MSSESISKSVVWQLVGKVALQGVAFFTTPIFTRILTPDDYGTIALYTSWSSILMVVLSLQTYNSIATARIRYSREEMPRYLSSILTLSLITYLVSFAIIIAFKSFFSSLFRLDETLVSILLIHSFASYAIAFFVAYLDQHKKVVASSLISVCTSVFSVTLALFFVLIFSNKVYGKVFGQTIPTVTFGIILVLIVYCKGRCFWNKEYNKYCMILTLPLIINGLGHMVFTQCDRILLERYQNAGTVGVYSVVYSFSNILSIIFAAINTAWTPFYYDFKKQKKTKEIQIHGKRYIKLISLMFVGFILLSFDVFKLMAPEPYWSGMKIIPFFVISMYFLYLYQFPVGFEYYCEKTRLIPVATIFTALINLFLDVILIQKYSALGAVMATMISQFLLFTFHFVMARFVIKAVFDFNLSFFIIPCFFVITAVIIGFFLMNLMHLRWILFLLVAGYILFDVIKHRSIF